MPTLAGCLAKQVVIFYAIFQIFSLNSYAQQSPGKQESELAIGVKIVTRQILYGHSNLYITDPNSISIQPDIRYDSPVKTSGSHFIDLVGQAGFLFCKAKVFDTAYTDPITNKYIYEHSHNPAYMPLSFGIYNMSGLSVGAEVFYWKGLGVRDIWGVKFLSLGYKGRQFRINACGEWYAQVSNRRSSGLLISVDVFVKLIKGRK